MVLVCLSDLEMCLKIIKYYNPWFPLDENLMDVENWDWVWINVEKAVKQGERIPVCFGLYGILFM